MAPDAYARSCKRYLVDTGDQLESEVPQHAPSLQRRFRGVSSQRKQQNAKQTKTKPLKTRLSCRPSAQTPLWSRKCYRTYHVNQPTPRSNNTCRCATTHRAAKRTAPSIRARKTLLDTTHTHTHTHNQPTKYMTTATVFRQTTLTRQRETTLKVIYAHCPPRVVLSSRCVVLLSRKQVSCCRGTNTTNERLNERRKQRSNEATKQRSNEAMNQRINESTKQRSNEATKERSNEATKQRRNDGTKQRRNEATKQQRSNEATKERTKELKSES